jgi:hypothetical protein
VNPWESVAGPLSYKKLWFLDLKHITPKYSQNKIWAVQNLENSVRTSVFGVTVSSILSGFHLRIISDDNTKKEGIEKLVARVTLYFLFTVCPSRF